MLTAEALQLLDRARTAEHAVDLYAAPGGVRLTADRVVEILRSEAIAELDHRALWNLLFTAGELSVHVDVYRAHELFRATIVAVTRVSATIASVTDPRAAALEMSLHFFFARSSHPLLPLRAREVIEAMAKLLSSGVRPATRAAIHGLGHLLVLAGDQRWGQDADQVLDEYLAGRTGTTPDQELTRYATEAAARSLA